MCQRPLSLNAVQKFRIKKKFDLKIKTLSLYIYIYNKFVPCNFVNFYINSET